MNNNDNLIKLKKATKNNDNNSFSRKALFRIENSKWLDYSSQIANRVLAIIEDNPELNQSFIAGALKRRRQQISKILKGEQNMTLKSIAELSDAIGVELISFPPYKDTYIYLNATTVSKNIQSDNNFLHVVKSENINQSPYKIPFSKTPHLVMVG